MLLKPTYNNPTREYQKRKYLKKNVFIKINRKIKLNKISQKV